MTATELKGDSQETPHVCKCNLSWSLTDRQIADYYLADQDIYKKQSNPLPSDKRLDSDGNRLSEATLYNNAVESIDVSQPNYTDDQKREIYSF